MVAGKASIYRSSKSDSKQLQEILRELDAEGQRQLESCEQLQSQEKYLQVVERYKDIIHTFRKLPCAVAAAKTLAQVEADPQYKRLLRKKRAEQLDGAVEELLENKKRAVAATRSSSPQTLQKKQKDERTPLWRVERIKSLPLRKQAKVVDLLKKMVTLSPGSQVSQRAASDLKLLRADRKFRDALDRYVFNTRAEKLYNAGEVFRKAKLYAKAMGFYAQVVEKFPDTNYAAKARDKATEMKAKTLR